MTTNTDLATILDLISKGAADSPEEGNAIIRALNARQKYIREVAGAAVAATLKPGDRVRITGEVRPLHFKGREGNVTAFNRTKVSVRLDGDLVDTRIPPAIVTKIADAGVETAEQATARLINAFVAENDKYPQYAGYTDGAVAVPLRKNWNHRGANFPKGSFVLLVKGNEPSEGYVSVWHPNLLMTTSVAATDLVLPKGASK